MADTANFKRKDDKDVITKVTKDNRTAYIDLFDKATAALPDGMDIIIYDLDTYFENLETLVSQDRSFLKLPLDEPCFEIVDGLKDGRRTITVPNDFKKNGISVQGDESAEIVWFSIDRYYDSTDLMGPSAADVANGKNPIHIVIQWETPNSKGVSMALCDSDNRPFIDKNDKLYFGWPISSEITQDAGNIKFNVRFYQFSGRTQVAVDADGNIIYDEETGLEKQVPILAFGLNTQTVQVKINSALNYSIDGSVVHNNEELALFKDADLILGKNETVLNRIQNSSKFYDESTLSAAVPEFIKNIDVTGLDTVVVQDSNDDDETFYVTDLGGVSRTEPLLFQVLARPKADDEENTTNDGLGFITYSGQKKAQPGNIYQSIMTEPEMINNYETIYKRADTETRLDGIIYYEKNELDQFVRATNLPDAGEEWRHNDSNNDYEEEVGEEAETLKYYVLHSPLYQIAAPGYFYIQARNQKGSRQDTYLASNKIFVPYPTALEDTDIVGGGTEAEPVASFLVDDQIVPSITVNATEGDTVIYQWSHKVGEDWLSVAGQTANAYNPGTAIVDNPGMFDELYSVSCHSTRNNATTASLLRYFRVTDRPHKFVFDMTTRELYSGTSNVMPEITIDFSQNLTEENNETTLNFLSDSIKYRWCQVMNPALDVINDDQTVTRNYEDDLVVYPAQPEEGEPVWATAATYTDVLPFTPEHEGAYYCEVRNVVNGVESESCYTGYVAADDVQYI